MATEPEDVTADTSGGEQHPKDGPTPAGVTAPARKADGTPRAVTGRPDDEHLTPEAAVALDTEMADADSLTVPGATPTRRAPTREQR
jgi:hypothetical protein